MYMHWLRGPAKAGSNHRASWLNSRGDTREGRGCLYWRRGQAHPWVCMRSLCRGRDGLVTAPPHSRWLLQTTPREGWRSPPRYLHHRHRNGFWGLSAASLMACPGWTGTSCLARGAKCGSFEGYLRHGAAGFGGRGCGVAQQKGWWPMTAREGPGCSFLTLPFGDP